jgi:protein involved in polysaccharide export with SLBB domain
MMRSAMTTFAMAVAMFFAGYGAIARAEEAPAPGVIYTDATPAYRFFPGDEIEITVFSAPELTRTVTVGPDGRIALPMIAPVRAADLTAAQLHDALVTAYAATLRTPELAVVPKTFASRQVYVGGEVANPGVYTMAADIDAFQAVALAGGFLTSARRGEVLVLSRASGESVVTEVDLSTNALREGFPDARPLQRYDIVYVPRSPISHVGLFMQQWLRDALPVQFSLYYDLNSDNRVR